MKLDISDLQNVDEIEGILYEDIKDKLIDKVQIENVLFTTKVVFLNKEELIEFINKLMEFGYEDMALDYVEDIYDKIGFFDWTQLKKYENKNK